MVWRVCVAVRGFGERHYFQRWHDELRASNQVTGCVKWQAPNTGTSYTPQKKTTKKQQQQQQNKKQNKKQTLGCFRVLISLLTLCVFWSFLLFFWTFGVSSSITVYLTVEKQLSIQYFWLIFKSIQRCRVRSVSVTTDFQTDYSTDAGFATFHSAPFTESIDFQESVHVLLLVGQPTSAVSL